MWDLLEMVATVLWFLDDLIHEWWKQVRGEDEDDRRW